MYVKHFSVLLLTTVWLWIKYRCLVLSDLIGGFSLYFYDVHKFLEFLGLFILDFSLRYVEYSYYLNLESYVGFVANDSLK